MGQPDRYVLYRRAEEHGEDCQRYLFEAIPRRVFLDTNVVNILVKWGEEIFEHALPPDSIDDTLASDIEALMHVFHIGSRAQWDVVISTKTMSELASTSDETQRHALLNYGAELLDYQYHNGHSEEEHRYATDFGRRLKDSHFVAALPDRADRELIAHAIAFGCDAFCTCDRRSVHRKRQALNHIPLRILTPAEWWQHIRPWAALWC